MNNILAAGLLSGWIGAVLTFVPGTTMAHGEQSADDDPHAAHRAMMEQPAQIDNGGAVEVEIHDLELLDQDGRKVRFKSDVIEDKLIVMSVLYTTCTTICPVTSAIFAQLQKRLGPRVGEDVRLVSLTVDPATDTPQRLKQYAKKFNAGPGWVWLTGEKRATEIVLDGIGAYTRNYREHPTIVLVGDGRTGVWKRYFGFPAPEQLQGALGELEQARGVSQLDAGAHQ